MSKISKSDIISSVAEESNLPKKVVKTVVDSTFQKISELMADGETITIQGFARFYLKEAQPRTFKKINSDETIEVGARQLPKARFSKAMIRDMK